MKQIVKNSESFKNVIAECKAYANAETWEYQKSIYLSEIKDIETAQNWNALTKSAIFHDAIGKVDNVTSNAVFVSVEY